MEPTDIEPPVLQHDPPEVRTRRFAASSVLRFASAGIQVWGGYTGGESALIVEGAEEFTDGMTFAAAAVEASSGRQGLTQKARNLALGFAFTATTIATGVTVSEVSKDVGSLMTPLEGIDLQSNEYKAALGALALNTIVFALNRHGYKSDKASDRFAFRDAVRDSFIPAAVLGLGATKAPLLAQYAFEAGGVAYGWYNAVQLFKGWRGKRSQT